MKAVAPAIFMGFLLASPVSVATWGEAKAEERVNQRHELKIDGMT